MWEDTSVGTFIKSNSSKTNFFMYHYALQVVLKVDSANTKITVTIQYGSVLFLEYSSQKGVFSFSVER